MSYDVVVSEHDPKDVASKDNPLLVQPMYQIFSITINRAQLIQEIYPQMYKILSLEDGVSCQVFGLVRVFVQNGKTIDIYNRSKENPEFVKFGGSLSIHGCPILQLGDIKVAIYLYDSAHDVEIANEIIEVDCDSVWDYDRLLANEANGEYGFAFIHHSIFQHGVSANIQCMVLKQVCDSGIHAHPRLYGTISAQLERSYTSLTSNVQEFPWLILFDNREATEFVQFDTAINLSTTCVVVPAFYSWNIKATFKDELGRDVSTDTKLSVRHEGLTENCCKGPNCEMKFIVKWCPMLDAAATQPKSQVSGAVQLPANVASGKPMMFPCVEVFSVLICMDKQFANNVGGSVEIRDSSHAFFVFNGEQTWYLNRDFLNLTAAHFSFDDEPFKVDISLVDEEKCVVSKGSFEWDCRKDDAPMFHDRFLCSVIQGDIGYAAVHYSMITHAVQANMEVFIFSNCRPNSLVRVHGSIAAEYGSYNYSRSYNQVYYKSTLFLKPKDDEVEVEIGSASSGYKLPLAKSLIAVPLDDLLITNLSLKVIGPGQKVKELEEILEFKTNGGGSCVVGAGDYDMYVRANCSYRRQFPGNKT